MSDSIKSECQEWNRTIKGKTTTVEWVLEVVRNNWGYNFENMDCYSIYSMWYYKYHRFIF